MALTVDNNLVTPIEEGALANSTCLTNGALFVGGIPGEMFMIIDEFGCNHILLYESIEKSFSACLVDEKFAKFADLIKRSRLKLLLNTTSLSSQTIPRNPLQS